ncbi:MAG TPA: hypothetical protein PLC54_04885 [Spirochaetales bacterium]|nr:hypothetical protein [Spirochaetales bacterium]
MPFLNPTPALIRRNEKRLELSIPNSVRALYLALAVVLMVILSRNPAVSLPILAMFGVVLALAILSEDRWIFDSNANELRRRYGLMIFAKSWALDLSALASIELDLDAYDSGATDPSAKIPGAIRKGWVALNAVMSDGKVLLLCAVPGRRVNKLREYGKAIGQVVGRPFIES